MSAIFVVLSLTGFEIPFIYPLLVIICAGYILEILMVKRVSPSLTYITRNTDSCTNCNLCTNSCPQEIDVAKMEKVTHIDCNLCGDCLYKVKLKYKVVSVSEKPEIISRQEYIDRVMTE